MKEQRAPRMPAGPSGEKRPADAVGLALIVAKIPAGEIGDAHDVGSSAAVQMGKLGGTARTALIAPERRMEIKNATARQRWLGKY